jgi:hypothetical protein
MNEQSLHQKSPDRSVVPVPRSPARVPDSPPTPQPQVVEEEKIDPRAVQEAFEDQQRREELNRLQEQNKKQPVDKSSIRKLIKMKAAM